MGGVVTHEDDPPVTVGAVGRVRSIVHFTVTVRVHAPWDTVTVNVCFPAFSLR
jgi:hypothetical protein